MIFKGDGFDEAESVGQRRRGRGSRIIKWFFLTEAFWASLRPGQVFSILWE